MFDVLGPIQSWMNIVHCVYIWAYAACYFTFDFVMHFSFSYVLHLNGGRQQKARVLKMVKHTGAYRRPPAGDAFEK